MIMEHFFEIKIKRPSTFWVAAILHFLYLLRRLVLKEVLYCLVGNHLLIENISTGLRTLHHFDNLCVSATILRTFVEGSNGFLCHVY